MGQAQACQECGKTIYFKGICYACRTRKERLRYCDMTEAERQKAVEHIVNNIEEMDQWEQVYKDFWGLLAYHDINTAPIAEAALAKGVFYPPAIYRDAPPPVRDQLMEMVRDPKCKDANNLLQCLAMCGDDEVLQLFRELDQNPLPWRKSLHADGAVYAQCAGWSYDAQGNRIQHTRPTCYALHADYAPDPAVKIGLRRKELCPICGCPTVDLMTIDGREPRLSFLALRGTVRIPACPNCAAMCEKTIVRYELDGDSTMEIEEPFADKNAITEKVLAELAGNRLALSPAPVPPFYACGGDDVCTIGGNPSWVQDWQYENCPDCGKPMKFLAAICWDTLMDGYEGTVFLEICTDCQVIIYFHQQT